MFELRGLEKSFGSETVIRRLDLSIAADRCTVLIGPSGCGKSTLLRLMLGLTPPDRGQVSFEGRPVVPGASLRSIRRRIGYVIQGGGLFPHLTARANITLAARTLGWSRERIGNRLDWLVELTRFPPEALERYPAELSGGQVQRVALMRALMLDPAALLMDEPLAALDPMIRHELQGELREIFRELGRTVVLVTHDLTEAAHFADRIVLMRDGRIVQSGGIEDLLNQPAEPFVTRFVTAQRAHLGDGAFKP